MRLLSINDDRRFTRSVANEISGGIFTPEELAGAVAMGANSLGGGRGDSGWFIFTSREDAMDFVAAAPVSRGLQFFEG